MMKINMVDVKTQYLNIKDEVDTAMQEVIDQTAFINGPAVKSFAAELSTYLEVESVIPCANGTDALQIAMMALGLQPGDHVMVPAFTYVATAEVIALLGLIPIMVEVDSDSCNLTKAIVEEAWTPEIRAVVPVHLYGQGAEMEGIMELSKKHGFYVIEDNAQSIGADYEFSDGTKRKLGTIGHIGTTSFYPSKNLGAYGDGGAIFTQDKELGERIRMVANHGQSKKYIHDVIGCNSRLDSLQAALLSVKLKHLDQYSAARNKAAEFYDQALGSVSAIQIPKRASYSNHVFHQYTLKIKNGRRDALKKHLAEKGIPSMIYYPLPLYKQAAFSRYFGDRKPLEVTEELCASVISLPMHTEMNEEMQSYITDAIKSFFLD